MFAIDCPAQPLGRDLLTVVQTESLETTAIKMMEVAENWVGIALSIKSPYLNLKFRNKLSAKLAFRPNQREFKSTSA